MIDYNQLFSSLALFVPNSAGAYESVAPLTLQAANQTFPFMVGLMKSLGHTMIPIQQVTDFCRQHQSEVAAEKLKVLFNQYGSDKSNNHNYENLYAVALGDPLKVTHILEIGLGTNNTDVVSNMGGEGKPGASLRAFRDYLPHAKVWGADIDERILFAEDRIATFKADQTQFDTFAIFNQQVPELFDLIIDDGLHSPNANLTVLTFALQKIKMGGWLVIEDIHPRAADFWRVVSALIPEDRYDCHFFDARDGYLFAVQRKK